MFRQSVMFPPLISGTEAAAPQPQPPPPVSLTESSRRQQVAASSPAKSQPLHNFPLSDLKWAMNHTNTHRLRKPSGKSPLRDAGNPVVEERNDGVSSSSSDSKLGKNKGTADGVSDLAADRSEKKSTVADVRSKILIRIRPKGSDDAAATSTAAEIDEDVFVGDRGSDGCQETEEFAPKTWNLRPRKPPPKKRPIGIGGGMLKSCSGSAQENKAQGTIRPESTRSRNNADAKFATERKEKKRKLAISLSKTEIEEDIFALTGSKPSRRPKKRVKNVQKQLDVLFPGLWMGNVTPDAYKVSDHA
ncbi:PREDICTED: uncharacterized protein LOC104817196 [Tarenaya hassleriana]|uniref:uncharacterized protein LOC104817196 n=1 Tax=Tarenaya hassleriana TaxID=28532 RepID=UPI00053C64EF|nr:PREDICTED: uncharacterized protein LOC104817196 [Tarenaya hassleriana]